MGPEDDIILWKAPQPGRPAEQEISEGFNPSIYPGNGPYFALTRELAEQWRQVYCNGIQEIHVPVSVFDDWLKRGIVQDDVYYPGESCHIPPEGLPLFNEALKRGSVNLYHPEAKRD